MSSEQPWAWLPPGRAGSVGHGHPGGLGHAGLARRRARAAGLGIGLTGIPQSASFLLLSLGSGDASPVTESHHGLNLQLHPESPVDGAATPCPLMD